MGTGLVRVSVVLYSHLEVSEGQGVTCRALGGQGHVRRGLWGKRASSKGSRPGGLEWSTRGWRNTWENFGACDSSRLKTPSGKKFPFLFSADISRDSEIINLNAGKILMENDHCYKLNVFRWAY